MAAPRTTDPVASAAPAEPATAADSTETGASGPWPSASLGDVTNAAEARDRARAALDDAEDEWRYAVGSAIDGGRAVEEVAGAAGTTEADARRIHDGRP